jgi:hypothetical protein
MRVAITPAILAAFRQMRLTRVAKVSAKIDFLCAQVRDQTPLRNNAQDDPITLRDGENDGDCESYNAR